ncbi:hypothetical protein R1sor_009639 [Riccia sorocarpa]|uniref:Uncharacterized protein n=1 Tax=Riccia sorocarpa TaxID=122646 RepID=A0ABD3HVT2_9MARC
MDMEIRQVQLEAQRRKAKGKTQEQNEEESESEEEEGGSKFWRTSMGGHKDGEQSQGESKGRAGRIIHPNLNVIEQRGAG